MTSTLAVDSIDVGCIIDMYLGQLADSVMGHFVSAWCTTGVVHGSQSVNCASGDDEGSPSGRK